MATKFDISHVQFDCAACAATVLPLADGRPAPEEAMPAAPAEPVTLEMRSPPPESATPTPPFTWEMVERQLAALAARPELAKSAGPLLRSIRRGAASKPTEMVLRELLCLAWVVLDERPPGHAASNGPE